MTGTFVEISAEDKALPAELEQLLDRGTNLAPAFAEIGEYGVETTRARILSQNQDDPVGSWQALSARYAGSKRKLKSKGAGRTLILHGYLIGTLHWQSDNESVEWGSDRIYAAAQQFGRPDINLPDRPFLGITEHNRTDIHAILQRWLATGQ